MNENARPKATEMVRKKTVVYSCSGCSDAGELADRTARALAKAKVAEMSCLAGIGGRVRSLMLKALRAEEILVIDGCPLNCARHTIELAGSKKFRHLELNKLGFKKGSCPVTEERIAIAKDAALQMIEDAGDKLQERRGERSVQGSIDPELRLEKTELLFSPVSH